MSSEQINGVLRRLTCFLPPDSPSYLERVSEPSSKERNLVIQVKDSISNIEAGLSFESLRERLQKEPFSFQEEITESDIKALAFLINKFGQVFKDKSGEPILPFDEQILALLRAVESYKNPKKMGLVLEMKTGEGKSSVVIPLLVGYFLLRGEQVCIHEINPFLLNESYTNFLKFAQVLAVEEEAGVLKDFQDKAGIMKKKKAVFGYWPTFIHYRQNQFLKRVKKRKDEKKREPILILDEVDQILNEETVSPAVISKKMVNSEKALNSYRQQLVRAAEDKKERVDIKIEVDEKNFSINLAPATLNPKNNEEFRRYITEFFEVLTAAYDKIKPSNLSPEKLSQYLAEHLRGWLFLDRVYREYEDMKPFAPSINEKLLEIYDESNWSFWWDNPGFQRNLIAAFLLREGVDYQIKEGVIQPLSQQTGYSEKGKEFETIISLLLYLKHGLPLPEKILGWGKGDRMPVLSYYLRALKNSKIFGFTGTAKEVSRRLREVYQLETSGIASHFPTLREEKIETFLDWDGRKKRSAEIIKSSGKNALVVVDTPTQAEEIKQILEDEKIAYRVLSAQNEEEDGRLYQWISSKGEEGERRVLICVKMVGRGVDLKPDDKVKGEGFLLILTTPFKYERSYQQLLGRVGRRGERGEVYLLLSPDDEIFSYLSIRGKEKLREWFRKQDKKKINQALKEAWGRWEGEITERMKYWGWFSIPIERLRDFLEGASLPYFEEELSQYGLDIDKYKKFIYSQWLELLDYLEDTFDAWLSAGVLGPFGQGEAKAIWTKFVFEETRRLFFNYCHKEGG